MQDNRCLIFNLPTIIPQLTVVCPADPFFSSSHLYCCVFWRDEK